MANDDTEQYRLFLEKLQREEFRPDALNDIKNLLLLKPAGEATTTIREAGISNIVKCLNLQDKAQVDLTCEVLKICFEKFETGAVVKDYTSHIMYLLRHEKSCVRGIALDEVYKAVTTDKSILPVPQYIDVFVAVAQLVSDMDIGVANKAITITSHLPSEAYPKVLEEMKIALEYNSSSKCNAFECVVNISCESAELCNLCMELGYLNYMISELDSEDLLYQLNILELLSKLAVTPHGINYLLKNGALQKISSNINQLKNNPLANLLLPGYIKFFGCVAHHYPKEIFQKYPVLLDCVFDAIDAGDQPILPVALDTLGFVGSTIEGKLCLAALGSKYTHTVQSVGEIIKTGTTEMKVSALNCFSCLISIETGSTESKPVNPRVTLMAREWFRSLSTNPKDVDVLFDTCRSPFPEIKEAGFKLLDAICQHKWGDKLVSSTAGFVEYLLDRSIDSSKHLKELKYDVIKKLSQSLSFHSTITARLVAYVEQGPFYAEPILQVAMEEGED